MDAGSEAYGVILFLLLAYQAPCYYGFVVMIKNEWMRNPTLLWFEGCLSVPFFYCLLMWIGFSTVFLKNSINICLLLLWTLIYLFTNFVSLHCAYNTYISHFYKGFWRHHDVTFYLVVKHWYHLMRVKSVFTLHCIWSVFLWMQHVVWKCICAFLCRALNLHFYAMLQKFFFFTIFNYVSWKFVLIYQNVFVAL